MTSVHDMCVVAERGEDCAFCHAAKGQPCAAGWPGVHLCRICAAVTDHLLTLLDEVSVIQDRDKWAGWDFVRDEEAAA